MTVWIVFLIVAFSLFVIVQAAASSRGRPSRGGRYPSGGGGNRRAASAVYLGKPPEALGIPAAHPARKAAERLEAALTGDFEARVKDRVMKPSLGLREEDWQWRWFELKRYFLMCGVLRSVPMYSEKVDDVWHEMLMFTREYEQFCRQFCGHLIHHAPHAPGAVPAAGERAWFDWVYGELFPAAASSQRLWGSFYRTPLPKEQIEEFELLSRDELLQRRFNANAVAACPELADAANHLLRRGAALAAYAREHEGRPRHRDRSSGSDYDPLLMTGVMSGVFFASSLGPDLLFQQQMDAAREEEKQKDDSGSGYYYGCSSGNDSGSGDNGNCSSGGDSGGSSCSSGGDSGGGSSCGGGGSSCGSGCGGGS